MDESQSNLIDIQKIIQSKMPKAAKVMPRFVMRWIKKLLHEDDINEVLTKYGHLYGVDFVNATIQDFNLTIEKIGEEHLSESDRIIVASNHPLGGLDGIALIGTVGTYRPDVITPVNDFLMFIKNLQPIFIPVNKVGANAKGNAADNVRIFNETFEGEKPICYFPFGLCSRKTKGGKIIDLEWKKTFVTKARQHQRDIIPTHINGKNSDFFYNLARTRKALHIKANLEMAFLVDEFFKQRNKSLSITFGKPIPWETFDKRHSDNEWARRLRNFSYNLEKDPNITFDPEKEYDL